jgi:predicted HicB family RNase H-like nuclease
METTRNLCAQIPIELHDKVREAREQSGKTLNQYMTDLLTNYFERGTQTMNESISTIAFQVPKELHQELKVYLKKHGFTLKEFMLQQIHHALEADKIEV